MTRRRKAWIVFVEGYDEPGYEFGPTAGKVRADVWRGLDCRGVHLTDITVRRCAARDIILPAPDGRAAALSEGERHCLLHAFGANDNPLKAGYRDYFYTRRDDPPLVALAGRGLMVPQDGDLWGPGMTYFVLTPEGRHVALSLTPEYAG